MQEVATYVRKGWEGGRPGGQRSVEKRMSQQAVADEERGMARLVDGGSSSCAGGGDESLSPAPPPQLPPLALSTFLGVLVTPTVCVGFLVLKSVWLTYASLYYLWPPCRIRTASAFRGRRDRDRGSEMDEGAVRGVPLPGSRRVPTPV